MVSNELAMEPSLDMWTWRLQISRYYQEVGCKPRGMVEKREVRRMPRKLDGNVYIVHYCCLLCIVIIGIICVTRKATRFLDLPPTASHDRLGTPSCTRSGKVVTFHGVMPLVSYCMYICVVYIYVCLFVV